jgi:hypothetical protein
MHDKRRRKQNHNGAASTQRPEAPNPQCQMNENKGFQRIPRTGSYWSSIVTSCNTWPAMPPLRFTCRQQNTDEQVGSQTISRMLIYKA